MWSSVVVTHLFWAAFSAHCGCKRMVIFELPYLSCQLEPFCPFSTDLSHQQAISTHEVQFEATLCSGCRVQKILTSKVNKASVFTRKCVWQIGVWFSSRSTGECAINMAHMLLICVGFINKPFFFSSFRLHQSSPCVYTLT